MKSFLQASLLVLTLAGFTGAHAVLTEAEKAFAPEQSLNCARDLFADAFNEKSSIPEGLSMRIKRVSAFLRQYNAEVYRELSDSLDRIASLPLQEMIRALKNLQDAWHRLEPQGHLHGVVSQIKQKLQSTVMQMRLAKKFGL